MENNPQIVLPSFCYPCQYDIVHGASMKETDSWRAAIIAVQLGLFQASARDPMVWERCSKMEDGKADADDLSLVFAEIGCLGCFKSDVRERLTRAIREDGLSAVIQWTREYPDEDYRTS